MIMYYDSLIYKDGIDDSEIDYKLYRKGQFDRYAIAVDINNICLIFLKMPYEKLTV